MEDGYRVNVYYNWVKQEWTPFRQPHHQTATGLEAIPDRARDFYQSRPKSVYLNECVDEGAIFRDR